MCIYTDKRAFFGSLSRSLVLARSVLLLVRPARPHAKDSTMTGAYIIVDGQTYPLGTELEWNTAREAIRAAGMQEAPILGEDSTFPSGSVLFAAVA